METGLRPSTACTNGGCRHARAACRQPECYTRCYAHYANRGIKLTVIGSNISWTNSTWNLATGCTKVSDGCDHCYAEELVNRIKTTFKRPFSEVVLHMDRLSHVRKFKPLPSPDGPKPHLVFVNSMSDFWHDAISERDIHRALDVMEDAEGAIFQILTKRPIRARRLLVERYRGPGVGIPKHIWIGVSTEDNRVAVRLNIMRSIRERVGDVVLFASVEPIVGPTDKLDFSGIEWVITGGESGPHARKMERLWLMDALERAQQAEAAIWHKQSGHIRSHPNIREVPSQLIRPADQMRWLREHGWELLPHEKGGATVDRQTYRQLPRAYQEVKAALSLV